MSKENIEKLLILLVLFIFISLGLLIYARYKDNDDEQVIVNNYYNEEFLFNNGYIKEANYLNSNEYKKENNNLIINDQVLGNIPNDIKKIYYNDLKNDCYEYGILENNDFYYVNICKKNKTKNFEKISTTAKNIYIASNDKESISIIDDKIKSNFIISTTLNEVKYISYKNNLLGLYENIEKIKPYFDYVCASNNLKICNDLIIYITFDNKLVSKNNIDNPIKDENNEDIIIQDIFGVFNINENIDKIGDIDINKLNQKYNYTFDVYVLDKSNYLYLIEISNKKEEIVATKIKEEKVKAIEYKEKEIIISFIDENPIKIKENSNMSIITSTLHDKNINN